jgi:predicted amidohydrolase
MKRRNFLALGSAVAAAVTLLACPAPADADPANPPSAVPTKPSPAPSAEDHGVAKIKIAAIALATVDGMVEANYARALRMAEISLKHKPDIILLPEAFAAGYCGKALGEYAEDGEKSQHLARFRRLSAQAGCMVVLGYLEEVEGDRRVRNAVVIYDRGEVIGRHYKHNLWVDTRRPYRDEPSLMIPGKEIEVFQTRFGRLAVLICYENMLAANWDALRGKVDYVLSPYNCEGDPSGNNIRNAKRLAIPSAWADRTGTVYRGDGYMMNPGTAGIVDASGKVIAHSQVGAEVIAVGEIQIRASKSR